MWGAGLRPAWSEWGLGFIWEKIGSLCVSQMACNSTQRQGDGPSDPQRTAVAAGVPFASEKGGALFGRPTPTTARSCFCSHTRAQGALSPPPCQPQQNDPAPPDRGQEGLWQIAPQMKAPPPRLPAVSPRGLRASCRSRVSLSLLTPTPLGTPPRPSRRPLPTRSQAESVPSEAPVTRGRVLTLC